MGAVILYPFGRMFVPNKAEDANLKAFNMVKGINESKTLVKYISNEYKCKLDGKKSNSRQKWNNVKCQCKYKKPIRHRTCEEYYAWNPSKRACDCNKDCGMDKYLIECACM